MKIRWGILLVVGSLGMSAGCSSRPEPVPAAPVALVPAEPVPSNLAEVLEAERLEKHQAAEAGLMALTRSGDEVTRRRALVMLGLLYQHEGRAEEAASTLTRALTEDPLIAPFLLLHLAEVQISAGRFAEAASSIASLRTNYPTSTTVDTARLLLPRLYAAAGDRDGASAATRDALSVPIDGLNEQELFNTAESLDKAGFADLGSSVRFRLLTAYPQGRFTEKVYQALVSGDPDSSPLLRLGYDGLLSLGDRLGRVNRYDQALDLLGRVAARFPQSAADPNFVYIRTSSLFNSRHYDDVVTVQPVSDQPYYLAIQLLRARAYWRTARNSEFLDILSGILKNYPSSSEATNAKILLSKYYSSDEIDYARAADYLSQAIAAGSRGSDGENLWTLGWIWFLAGNEAKALDSFSGYVAAYPDADYTSNALFWSGKIHDRAGRTEERNSVFGRLIDFYPYSYYSYRAREIIGAPPVAPSEVPGRDQFPSLEIVTGEGAQAQLDAIHELMAVDLHEDAARELQRIAAGNMQNKLMAFTLAELYAEAGQPLRANATIQKNFRGIVRHGGSQVPRRFWEILYPRDYWDQIEESAKAANVDPYLVSAIIRQESAFDPSTVSNAGAVGLMQIMPAEASRIAERGALGFAVTREDLFDPARNIAIGAAEIRQKLDAMNGSQVLAVASYNAGEEAVGRWIAKAPIDDIDLFVESIPFSETRLYVKSVTRNLYEYRRIYGSP